VDGALALPGQYKKLFAFANDSTLRAAAPDESSLFLKLQLMTENMYNWFDANLLGLNVKKIVSSYILPHRQKLPYSDRASNI